MVEKKNELYKDSVMAFHEFNAYMLQIHYSRCGTSITQFIKFKNKFISKAKSSYRMKTAMKS